MPTEVEKRGSANRHRSLRDGVRIYLSLVELSVRIFCQSVLEGLIFINCNDEWVI